MSLPQIRISQNAVKEMFPVAAKIMENFEDPKNKKENYDPAPANTGGISAGSVFGFIFAVLALILCWGFSWNSNLESPSNLTNNITKKLFDTFMALVFNIFYIIYNYIQYPLQFNQILSELKEFKLAEPLPSFMAIKATW